jgi:hypothetical protein
VEKEIDRTREAFLYVESEPGEFISGFYVSSFTCLVTERPIQPSEPLSSGASCHLPPAGEYREY